MVLFTDGTREKDPETDPELVELIIFSAISLFGKVLV